MTHSINLDYDNVTDPNGTVMCDQCNATATVTESADGSWEFVYGSQFELLEVLCPDCSETNQNNIAAAYRKRRAAATGIHPRPDKTHK